jgi:hypothetical protein
VVAAGVEQLVNTIMAARIRNNGTRNHFFILSSS